MPELNQPLSRFDSGDQCPACFRTRLVTAGPDERARVRCPLCGHTER